MKRTYLMLFFILVTNSIYAQGVSNPTLKDSTKVILLNKSALDERFVNPSKTVNEALKAMAFAYRIRYERGIAESYRVKGIGESYANHRDSALKSFSEANIIFTKLRDENGMTAVYNNLGNLYQTVNDEKALENFNAALALAKKHKNNKMIASVYRNMSNIYDRKK